MSNMTTSKIPIINSLKTNRFCSRCPAANHSNRRHSDCLTSQIMLDIESDPFLHCFRNLSITSNISLTNFVVYWLGFAKWQFLLNFNCNDNMASGVMWDGYFEVLAQYMEICSGLQ